MPSITFLGIAPDSPRPSRRLARAQPIPRPSGVDGLAGLTSLDLASLRGFRVSAPTTRILVELPDDFEPPDDGLAQVVGMGITDIVRAGTPLPDALDRTPTYADVAMWQGSVRTFDEPDPMVEKIVKEVVTVEREKIVERKIGTSTRPTVIAVAGMLAGVGVTSVAVALTRYLTGEGWAVALSEHGPTLR
jgi:hypothetical protein